MRHMTYEAPTSALGGSHLTVRFSTEVSEHRASDIGNLLHDVEDLFLASYIGNLQSQALHAT